jgi:hypothetical protein
LRDEGFELVRDRKHKIYRNADGKTLTTGATPSDWRASRNALRDLRGLLKTPAPAPASTTDAILPKQAKRSSGARVTGTTSEIRYHGTARAAITATPEETITSLQGYLRSHDAYKFKSGLQREVARTLRNGREKRTSDLWAARAVCKDLTIADKNVGDTLWRYAEHLEMVDADTAVEYFNLDEDQLRVILEFIDCELHTITHRKDAQVFADVIDMTGRAANRLLRGESAAELRAFVARETAKIAERRSVGFRAISAS